MGGPRPPEHHIPLQSRYISTCHYIIVYSQEYCLIFELKLLPGAVINFNYVFSTEVIYSILDVICL